MALLILAVKSRPDIDFAVNLFSQACKSPKVQSFIAEKKSSTLFKGNDFSLTFSRHDNGLAIFAYSDADWANDFRTRKSVSGMVIKLNDSDSLVFWRTTKQRSISLSTCEPEYMTLSALAQQVLFLKHVLLR